MNPFGFRGFAHARPIANRHLNVCQDVHILCMIYTQVVQNDADPIICRAYMDWTMALGTLTLVNPPKGGRRATKSKRKKVSNMARTTAKNLAEKRPHVARPHVAHQRKQSDPAAKKAARTRAANKRKRSARAKKAAATRRETAVARRQSAVPPSAKRLRSTSKAKRSRAAKKAWATRRRNASKRSRAAKRGASKRKRTSRRKPATRQGSQNHHSPHLFQSKEKPSKKKDGLPADATPVAEAQSVPPSAELPDAEPLAADPPRCSV